MVLFSILVKQIFEPIILWKKSFCFFKSFSWDTDVQVTLGDLTVKNATYEEESVFWTKID